MRRVSTLPGRERSLPPRADIEPLPPRLGKVIHADAAPATGRVDEAVVADVDTGVVDLGPRLEIEPITRL